MISVTSMNEFLKALPAIIAAVFSGIAVIIGSLNHSKAKTSAEAAVAAKEQISILSVQVNGRLTELIDCARISSHALGKAEGMALLPCMPGYKKEDEDKKVG